MQPRQKILIADACQLDAGLISSCLAQELYSTRTAADGPAALRMFTEFKPDLVITDAVLPGVDGFQLLRELRRTANTPLIMVSSKTEVFDRVLGLELGADDYLCKPFDNRELLARVKAVLRRYQPPRPPSPSSDQCVEYPDLVVNLTNYSVLYKGGMVEMPPKELELLYFLAASPNQVFSREQLLDRIWGYDYMGDTRTVDVHIKRIREKIKNHKSWAIATVWGIGYKFRVT